MARVETPAVRMEGMEGSTSVHPKKGGGSNRIRFYDSVGRVKRVPLSYARKKNTTDRKKRSTHDPERGFAFLPGVKPVRRTTLWSYASAFK
jgi:hypothetical protein